MKKKQSTDKVCEPQSMDFGGLRIILFEELNLLRAGQVSIARARIVSQLSRRIIEGATLDMYARNMLGKNSPEELKRLMSENVQS